jgi:hypothetical protein
MGNGDLKDRRMLLKLAFAEPLSFIRKEGYRTPELSLPFKMLGSDFGSEMKMVPLR